MNRRNLCFAASLVAFFFISSAGWGANPQQQWAAVGDVSQVTRLSDGVEFTAGRAKISVTAVTDSVVRVRVAPQGVFLPEVSWAVLYSAGHQAPRLTVQENDAAVGVTILKGQIQIMKAPTRLIFRDTAGEVISEDDPLWPMAFNGTAFRVTKKMPEDETYSGLGDKTSLNLRNHAFTMWNTDSYGWQESTDPLYKSIPFFMALRAGRAYGIFLDNTWRSYFDFGKQCRDSYQFGAEGGELNYYFLFGPEPKDVLREYAALTGTPPLLPLWAFGYQQSRYSYYPESKVRDLARIFRDKKIPADAIYLDIDYQDHYRPFTVNTEYFPHFRQMVQDLRRDGFTIVVITDPHIAKAPSYKPYDEGLAGDDFVKNADGTIYEGEAWPGESVFPDFTLSSVRRWWGTLYQDFISIGVGGFWNDMNEPSIFNVPDKTMPLSVVHRVDKGAVLVHRAAHNIYGMQNSRATYEGLLRLANNERPFVLTRATYAGGQRYAASWTGDNSSTWNHMRVSVPQLLNLGISGFPFVGADIGGFVGSPTADLLTRWIALGAFNPLYRNHTDKDTAGQEPWAHGLEHELVRKKFIEQRYLMLPYIYTVAEEASRTGLPMMRPLFVEFPDDKRIAGNQDEFMFGPDLLVAPKLWDQVDAYNVQLPRGTWFDYWTGEKLVLPPGQSTPTPPRVNAKSGDLPVYVRAGAIVPHQPLVQSTREPPQGPLELRVYPGPNCLGHLYVDDGHTLNYKRGEFLRQDFTCSATEHSVVVELQRAEGSFTPWFHEIRLAIYGITSSPSAVSIDGTASRSFQYDAKHHVLSLTLVYQRTGTKLDVQY
jgi:alpha-glucosidase